MAKIPRIYSYIFHFALGAVFLALGVVTMAGGADNLKLGMLPWNGAQLTWAVLALGAGGLIVALAAATGRVRFLLPLWALFIFGLLFRGFFLTPFVFKGAGQFRGAVWLTLGALAALLGSLSLLRRRDAA